MAPRRRGKATGATATADKNGPAQPIPWARGLAGRPEWEAMKASARNLSHDAAVHESARLTAQYRKMWCPMAMVQVDLDKILQTLRSKKVPFVLTGAHGIAGWTGRPRSTQDIDILVKSGRNHARAVKALRTLYPQLEVRALAGVTAFFMPGETMSVIDVTIPHRADIAATLETAIWVERGAEKYRIPTLEAALANKYGAMLTPTRDPIKRSQDAIDFAGMVRHSTEEGRQPIDLETLAALGEKVWPGGGGKEILYLAEQAKTGIVPNVLAPQGPR